MCWCAHAARQLLSDPGLPANPEGTNTSADGGLLQPRDFVIAIPTQEHRESLLPSSRASRQVSIPAAVCRCILWRPSNK